MSIFDDNNIYTFLTEKFGIVGKSALMKDAMMRLYQAAPTDLTVLITGDTGTGKEVFAHALHGLSKRKKFQFVSVNCAAIPETLLESELFGHEKGAFTGASDQRKGFFESANRGTIFLDEIGEMPYSTQVKLLRILESGEYSRLGSSLVHKVDVRVIAATNRELGQEIANGGFRQDLYFRLKSVNINLPNLREHVEDIPLLIEYFAQKVSTNLGIKFDGVSQDAMSVLKSLPWHGNIRELKNMIESLITLEQVSFITPDILRRYITPALPAANYDPIKQESSLIPITGGFDNNKNLEFELIFRTLLDLKTEVTDMKRYLHSLTLQFEDLKNDIGNNYQTPYNVEEINEDVIDLNEMELADIERKAIEAALSKSGGNRRKAAQSLGISERTLYRKIMEMKADEEG